MILGWLNENRRLAECLLPLEYKFQEESRHNRYLIDPKDMLVAENQTDGQGLTVISVFHSHPDQSATPSEHDCQWELPWYSYVITSLHLGKALESRSWRLVEDRSRFIDNFRKFAADRPAEGVETGPVLRGLYTNPHSSSCLYARQLLWDAPRS